jgi:hypothetical protein
VSSLDDDWTIGLIDVTCTSDNVTDAQSLIHVYGNRSTLGPISIHNKGTGGVNGLRYAAATTGLSDRCAVYAGRQ